MKRITISLFNFMDQNSSGKVSFHEMIHAIYPSLLKIKRHSELINNWMQEYNTAKSNFTKRKRVEKRAKIKLPEHGIERLKKIFQTFDKDRKGYFTYDEFKAQLSDMLPETEIKKLFEEKNLKGDGKMTFSDYIRMVVSKNSKFDLSEETLAEIEKFYIKDGLEDGEEVIEEEDELNSEELNQLYSNFPGS